MGGTIGLSSQVGAGSTFWFTLTCDKGGPIAERLKRQNKSNFILLADDNPINQKIAVRMVQSLGYRAQSVATGREVLSALRERSYELVLMDCQMPDLDGFETTAKIRLDLQSPFNRIPIIAMTASVTEEDKSRCLACGMNDYLSKPVKPSDLEAVIERNLIGTHSG